MDYNILPGHEGEIQQESNAGVYARFYIKPVENKFATAEAGRPIYKDVEYVEITMAGDRNNILNRKASDVDKKRFARQYENFKSGITQSADGTPIEQWPMVSRSKAEELKHFNIHTVEALAEVPDTGIQAMGMGARALVEQAKTFLAVANETADTSKLVAENENLKSEIGVLKLNGWPEWPYSVPYGLGVCLVGFISGWVFDALKNR